MLRQWKALGTVEDRRQQLVEAGKGELHLRLHAHCSQHSAPRRTMLKVFEQRCLPNTGLAPQHESLALADSELLDYAIQDTKLALPALEPRRSPSDDE